ncbi:vacuolar protein sorting-associated protein 51 homolog [Condylostylus longicornis]|uniref:vacuolar protein sorting-associated protein 51 homolog n=1 Tax=Condylostylus longicornis TaxID=2530218 RepID=UPI00244DF7C5|nr:vacuolar protein sorting-associated protein 51 homolog [Condylostylus longicornis]
MEEQNINPYNMDGTDFDSEKYLEKLLKECSLKEIMDTEALIVKDTQTLHSEMQTLVYENYNKFISATDTIRKMKNDFKKMEVDMKLLKEKMNAITTFSGQITNTLEGSRSQLVKLSEKHSLLKRLQFLSSLPSKLESLIENGKYAQAVQDYKHAQKVFQQYGQQPSFRGIQNEGDSIMENLKQKLRTDFQRGSSAQSLTETGEILLQLNENPCELASEMLQCATKRLHEQIIMLQDQTDLDMIEFVDLGIESFLNDMTLVVTAFYDMFLNKDIENERDDFKETAMKDLNSFMNKNIDKYLSLVQDRVESETDFGNTELMLRGLDRLHRRLLAMRNIAGFGVELNRSAIDIIVSAAQHICQSHSKTLKDHFTDNLSSVRLSLVSAKTDNCVSNLNELITSLYISTIEKVKGVLQDLHIFLKTNWSFNIKADLKGSLCVEGIRENLLIDFLRYISKTMNSFSDLNSTSPPSLLLVLSKTCTEMEQNGVHILISLVDELYDIDSELSTTLSHETEVIGEMREVAQNLLDSYVRVQGINISQMLRKSIETRDWLNCLEPRTVRAVMKRVVEELTAIENVVANLYESGNLGISAPSSDSSRKTHFSNLTNSKQQYRSNWSNYSSSQLDSSYVSNIHKLFSERIEIFTSVEFSKVSIITGIIKISLKTFLECVRLKTFSKFGLQQIQVDTHFLQMNLWRFVSDENLVNFLLDEILGSTVYRCLEPVLMEPNAVEIICER